MIDQLLDMLTFSRNFLVCNLHIMQILMIICLADHVFIILKFAKTVVKERKRGGMVRGNI